MICCQLSHSGLVVRQGDILPKPNLSPYHDQKVSKKRFDPDLEAPMQNRSLRGIHSYTASAEPHYNNTMAWRQIIRWMMETHFYPFIHLARQQGSKARPSWLCNASVNSLPRIVPGNFVSCRWRAWDSWDTAGPH